MYFQFDIADWLQTQLSDSMDLPFAIMSLTLTPSFVGMHWSDISCLRAYIFNCQYMYVIEYIFFKLNATK